MHPLIEQLRAVGRRAHRLLLCRAAALWACVILAAMLVAGCADFWFRYSEVEVRWIASGIVAAVGFWAAVRLVWPAIWFRRTEHTIAQWVERRFPELQDRLSSAVTFVGSPADDPRYGSSTLRQSVVQEASAVAATKNLHECLDPRPVQRAAWILLATSIVVLSVCAADVQSATIAMRRMVMPWSDDAWPRRTWLMITKRPQRMAVGQDFDVEVIDRRGWLPSEVNILYWFDGDPESEVRIHRMNYAGGKMTHRMQQVNRSFRYRAVGGDDTEMEWTQLVVVEAPRISTLKIDLQPPAYSGLAPSTSNGAIRGLVGTAVRITGTVSAPIRSVEMHLQVNAATTTVLRAVPGANGLDFQFPVESASPYLLQHSGRYGWALVDHQGVSNQLELNRSLEVLSDAPPTIAIEAPQPDTPFTGNAVVKLRIVVKDDLAVKTVVLEAAEKRIPLVERDSPPSIDNTVWPPRGEQQTLEHSIDLRELGALQPGQAVQMRITASDFRPHLSEPVEITFNIISAEEFKNRLDELQSALLQRVQEALRLQRDVRSQLQSFHEKSKDSNQEFATRFETLSALEVGQKRVHELTGDQGALGQVSQLLAELSNNRVDDTELQDHLSATQKELMSLVTDLLPPIEWQIGDVAKRSRSRTTQKKTNPELSAEKMSAAVLPDVLSAIDGQDRAIEAFERIVDRLGQWSDYRLFARDVAEISEQQQSLLTETQSLPTAAHDVNELSESEQARLRILNNRQRDLASRLDRLHQRLERMRQKLGVRDEAAAATMDAALDVLREEGIASEMREAAIRLGQNRVGAAENLEQRVLEALTQLHSVLAQRVEEDPARILEQLSSIRDQVDQIRREHAAVEKLAAAAQQQVGNERRSTLDEIAQWERRLIAVTGKLERKLGRLPGNVLARMMQKAMQHMQAAEEAAKQGDAGAAQQSADQAAQQLAEAAKQLGLTQQDAREDQANKELRWLKEALTAFLSTEQGLRDQTSELAKQVAGKTEFTTDQGRQAETFSQQQFALSKEVEEAEKRMQPVGVFSYALQRVASAMQRAGERLVAKSVDAETVELQSQAMNRIQRLLEAMSQTAVDPDTTPPPASEPDGQQEPATHERTLAELRLLRAWQQEINDRTDVLIKVQSETKSLTPQQIGELDELVAEQKKLAEFVEQFEGQRDVIH